jgi:hypothetical protein
VLPGRQCRNARSFYADATITWFSPEYLGSMPNMAEKVEFSNSSLAEPIEALDETFYATSPMLQLAYSDRKTTAALLAMTY